MPKGKVETVPVDKNRFIDVVKARGYSIRRLDDGSLLCPSDKTIRRELNNGQMRPEHLDYIAKRLDVSSLVLSGEIVNNQDVMLAAIAWKYILNNIEKYTYFSGTRDVYFNEGYRKLIRDNLMFFYIDDSQYSNLPLDKQFDFKKDLLKCISKVIENYFKKDAMGDSIVDTMASLEFFLEDEDKRKIIECEDRPRLIKNPPHNYSSDDIKVMDWEDLFFLCYGISDENSEKKEADT